jgi:DNA-binding response OmpR family regulator
MAHILVIDDEQAIVDALRQILERAGHEVLVAPHGESALRLFDSQFDLYPIDLVITDIWMPEQDGLETIMQLRKRSSAIKILAMSGGGRYGLMEFLKVAKQLGADSTLHKPFTQMEVLEAVRGLLES